MGMEGDATKLAKANIEAFNSLEADAVLSPCPTCTLAIQKHFPALTGEAINNAMDPAEFLLKRADHLQYKEKNPIDGATGGATGGGGFMYHEPCHLASGLGAGQDMKDLMTALGIEFTEPSKPNCCGFSQAGVYPEVSDAQLDPLAEEFQRAETLITSCPGCVAQLARKHQNVVHILELIKLKGSSNI
jgi:Fe-S oxidoreductase